MVQADWLFQAQWEDESQWAEEATVSPDRRTKPVDRDEEDEEDDSFEEEFSIFVPTAKTSTCELYYWNLYYLFSNISTVSYCALLFLWSPHIPPHTLLFYTLYN
jgi:hypothetical protein